MRNVSKLLHNTQYTGAHCLLDKEKDNDKDHPVHNKPINLNNSNNNHVIFTK